MDLPKDAQAFPHHTDMYQYFLNYAEKFDLVRHVRFKSRVTDVGTRPATPTEAPKWEVDIEGGETGIYDFVIVASGHLPRPGDLPEFTKFSGEYLHSHYYREPEPFAGKRVCVIGGANSAFDICSDVCVIAKRDSNGRPFGSRSSLRRQYSAFPSATSCCTSIASGCRTGCAGVPSPSDLGDAWRHDQAGIQEADPLATHDQQRHACFSHPVPSRDREAGYREDRGK